MLLENGKRKYITHSIITKLLSALMNRFVFKFWGPFLSSTTDSSPDGPIFPGFRSERIAMDYRLRQTYRNKSSAKKHSASKGPNSDSGPK